MLNKKIIINADLKGQTLEDGLYIKVQVRENIQAVILKAFISMIVLKISKRIIHSMVEDLNKLDSKSKKGRIYDVEA